MGIIQRLLKILRLKSGYIAMTGVLLFARLIKLSTILRMCCFIWGSSFYTIRLFSFQGGGPVPPGCDYPCLNTYWGMPVFELAHSLISLVTWKKRRKGVWLSSQIFGLDDPTYYPSQNYVDCLVSLPSWRKCTPAGGSPFPKYFSIIHLGFLV